MIRGTTRKDFMRWRWTAFGCAAALAAAWIGLGHSGTMPGAPAAHDVAAVEPAEAAAPAGAGPYGQYCSTCHQTTGKGMPGVFPPLAGSPVVTGDPHYLARIVLYGISGRIAVGGQTFNTPMAGFGKNMNDGQIADLLTYIRSSWGNNAPAVTADVVAAERAIPGTPEDNGAKYPK